MKDNSEALVASMTTQEKASLTSGGDFWNTKSLRRLGVPAVMLTDGPHGLRKQAGTSDHLGLNDSIPATCFPPAVALGATFDPAADRGYPCLRQLPGLAGACPLRRGHLRGLPLVRPPEAGCRLPLRSRCFVVEGDDHVLGIGASSRDIRCKAVVPVEGDDVQVPLSMNSSLSELLAHPVAGPKVRELLDGGPFVSESILIFMGSFPIGRLVTFPGSGITHEQVLELLEHSNATDE